MPLEQHSHTSRMDLGFEHAGNPARATLIRELRREDAPRSFPLGVDARRRAPAHQWRSIGDDIIALSVPPLSRAANASSVAIHATGSGYAAVSLTTARLKTEFKVQVFLPIGSTVEWLQPFALRDALGDWQMYSEWVSGTDLQRCVWNEVTVSIPAVDAQYWTCGVEFYLSRPTYSALYLSIAD